MDKIFWLMDAKMARLQLLSPASLGVPRVDDPNAWQRFACKPWEGE